MNTSIRALTALHSPLLLTAILIAAPAVEGTAFATGPVTSVQGELPSNVRSRMDRVEADLGRVAEAFEDKDLLVAEAYLDSARSGYERIGKDYEAKFDTSHQDWKALGESVRSWTERLAEGPEKKDNEPELDARARRGLEQLDRPLNAGEGALAAGQIDRADEYLQDVRQRLADLEASYALPTEHSLVDSVNGRIDALSQGIGEQQAAGRKVQEELPALVEALNQAHASLAKTRDQVRTLLQELSSSRADFNRDQDSSRFGPLVARATVLAQEIEAVLPVATAAAAHFRRQHADPYALGKRFPEARGIHNTLEDLETMAADWQRERASYLTELVDEAATVIERHEGFLTQAGSDPVLARNRAEMAQVQVLGYARSMIDAVLAFYPSGEGELANKARALEPRVAGVAQRIGELRGATDAAERALLEGARFPQTEYRGGEWTEVTQEMRAAFGRFAEGSDVLRIAVSRPWEERTEARWRDRWIIGTYRYVSSWVAETTADGHVRVHSISFRRTLGTDGAWSRLEVFGVGRSFQMLAENL